MRRDHIRDLESPDTDHLRLPRHYYDYDYDYIMYKGEDVEVIHSRQLYRFGNAGLSMSFAYDCTLAFLTYHDNLCSCHKVPVSCLIRQLYEDILGTSAFGVA